MAHSAEHAQHWLPDHFVQAHKGALMDDVRAIGVAVEGVLDLCSALERA
jgi:hypothetical protein